MKIPKVVYVEWLDAVGTPGGWDEDLSLKGVDGKVVSIGLLLDSTDEFVLVAGHFATDQVQGAVAIPRDMISSYSEVTWV